MPEQLRSIKFLEGLNRRENAPLDAIYDIENAKLGRNGIIQEIGAATEEVTARTEYGKPYFEWNSYIIDRGLRGVTVNDRAIYPARSPYPTIDALHAMETYGGNLYASAESSDSDWPGEKFYGPIMFRSNYTPDASPEYNRQAYGIGTLTINSPSAGKGTVTIQGVGATRGAEIATLGPGETVKFQVLVIGGTTWNAEFTLDIAATYTSATDTVSFQTTTDGDATYTSYEIRVTYTYGQDQDDFIETVPPLIYGGSATAIDMTTYTGVSSSSTVSNSTFYVHYILIPYDEDGNQGPWSFLTGQSNLVTLNAGSEAVMRHISLFVIARDNVARVEIYRTTNRDDRGLTHFDGNTAGFSNNDFAYLRNNTFVNIGELSPVSNTTGSGSYLPIARDRAADATFVDNYVILTDGQFIDWKDNGAYGDETEVQIIGDGSKAAAGTRYGTTIVTSTSNFQSIENQRRIFGGIVWTEISPGVFEHHYKGVKAEVMYNDGGTMMYGNVTVPTYRPLHTYKQAAGATNDIKIVLEFEDETGAKYYGQEIDYTSSNVESLSAIWYGEKALLIFRDVGAGFVLWERLEPSPEGMYITKYKNAEGEELNVAYHENAVQPSTPTWTSPDTSNETREKEFKNVILMSLPGAPLSITLNAFSTPEDTSVRLIQAVRLAEEEGLVSYSFAVFTDRTVQMYAREGTTVKLVDTLATNLGIKAPTVGFNAQQYTYPVYTLTESGLVFAGTDGRIYLLDGRKMTPMDNDIPSLISNPLDMAYDTNTKDLYVLDGSSTIWIYNFIDQDWVGRIEMAATISLTHLFYSNDSAAIFGVGTKSSTTETYLFDGGGADGNRTTVNVVTQPIDDGGTETKVAIMEINYKLTGYSNTDSSTWATMRHSIDNSAILNPEGDNGGTDITMSVPKDNPIYPALRGRGHQFKVIGFEELRDVEFRLELEE